MANSLDLWIDDFGLKANPRFQTLYWPQPQTTFLCEKQHDNFSLLFFIIIKL